MMGMVTGPEYLILLAGLVGCFVVAVIGGIIALIRKK